MASNYAHDNEDLGSTFSEDPGTLAVKRYSDSDGPIVSNKSDLSTFVFIGSNRS